jgi:hypothetical protein
MNAPQDSGPRRGLLPRFTLKDGDTFLLADALGDIHDREDGLFTDDTRILSKFELSVASRPVSLLGAAVSQDNTTFIAHLTNRPLPTLGEQAIPQGVIHIERRRTERDEPALADRRCHRSHLVWAGDRSSPPACSQDADTRGR